MSEKGSSSPEGSPEVLLEPQVVDDTIDNYYDGFPGFDEFGGLDSEIAQLKQSYLLAKNPDLCEEWDIEPVKGIMLCGPGGVGKTGLTKALAKETDSYLEIVQPSSILTKWVGEPVRKLREAFEDAADNDASTILFFDEFDGLFSSNASGNPGVQQSLQSEMKTLMNSVPRNVLVIAATNSLEGLDPALLRAGRFDTVIQIPLPRPEVRGAIIGRLVYRQEHLYDLEGVLNALPDLVAQTDGMSGADITNILKAARTKRVVSHLNLGTELGRITSSDIMTAIAQHRTSRPS